MTSTQAMLSHYAGSICQLELLHDHDPELLGLGKMIARSFWSQGLPPTSFLELPTRGAIQLYLMIHVTHLSER